MPPCSFRSVISVPPSSKRSTLLGLLADWSNSTRSELLVLGAFPYAVGAAFAGESIPKVAVASLAGVGLHWSTVLVNNLVDRQSDSLHPRKQRLAIVAGRITSRQVIVAILASFVVYLTMLFATVAGWAVFALFMPLAVTAQLGDFSERRQAQCNVVDEGGSILSAALLSNRLSRRSEKPKTTAMTNAIRLSGVVHTFANCLFKMLNGGPDS